jgi:hypothetical protein
MCGKAETMSTAEFKIKPLTSSAPLSKSKFVHGMQCPLYVWLEVRTDAPQPEPGAFTQALFAAGNEVGGLARQRWDRRRAAAGKPAGVLITDDHTQHDKAVEDTAAALANGEGAIYEAAFTYNGVKVRVDVLERLGDGTFALHEVKSTSKYDEKKHLLDAAVQLWVVRGAGLRVSYVGLVYINSAYEWPGGDYDLERLFAEEDVTEAAEAVQEAVGIDVGRLLRVLDSDEPPVVPDDVKHKVPYECPYLEICPAVDHSTEHPVGELPSCSAVMRRRAEAAGCRSLLEIDEQLAQEILVYSGGEPNPRWLHTWKATVTGERIILDECPQWIGALRLPIRHLDFETVGAPLPIVLNTHPFEAVPLQYSIHIEDGFGELEHRAFIADPDDPDPRRTLIERMLEDLGEDGDIIHWSPYERTVILHLAAHPRYAQYRNRLAVLALRLSDLGKAVNDWVFDGDFHGRWSIKKVYPVLVPGGDSEHLNAGESQVLSYDDLDGVAKGDEAAMMLLEYLRPQTAPERRADIRRQLLTYCELDTWATVEVLRVLRAECEGRHVF